jgi:tetratricopeptide (TPR) repeat protein
MSGDTNLRCAIACYEAALRVRTESDFPSDWAMTQNNLGLAFRDLGNLDDAAEAFESAARGLESVGDRIRAGKASLEAEKSRHMNGL